MSSSVYVTGIEPSDGRATVALGVTEMLSSTVQRLGAFRPIVHRDPDPTLALLRERYKLTAIGFGTTYAQATALIAAGHVDELVELIVDAYQLVATEVDAAIIIGTDFGRSGEPGRDSARIPDELALNARLATELRAPLLAVVDGRHRDAEEIGSTVRGAYHILADLRVTQLAYIASRTVPGTAGKIAGTVADLPVHVYAIDEAPAAFAPTVAQVADALQATRLLGNADAYARDVRSVVVGGATVPTFLDHLSDGALVIAPGDRADLIIATYGVHVAGEVTLAGVMLTLGIEPDKRVLSLVDRLGGRLPVCVAPTDTYETVAAVGTIDGRLAAGDQRKVEAALGAFDAGVDVDQLAARLDITRSARVTPLMFEHEIRARARALHRHVVLPEGAEERILRATEILLRRGVCDVTLLGHEADVARRIRELALGLDGASIVDPTTSPWRDEFAAEYARLRASRGVTHDMAHDIMADENYFGTMMVHLGYADAMVSGAVHPTADTIRPAFEIIRTSPGVSIASSVFFMCLPDQVLVYGDCAINPDPDPAQLADIAISAADTAAAFGVEPRVAMLSYSTGVSGHGADVDKVAAATTLVRARRPELPVEGPIQYDAAVDPIVGAAKAPGSPVAGRATVLIFPDLNTGNNTYKAVQRSANAIAVGPVLQGLAKPVNDLSRGATVPDIVNTVAITAIQAGIA